MHLEKFINSKTGKILSSIILGIGLATLFHSACKGKNCRLYYAPPLKESLDKTFSYNDKCYKYKTESVTCDAKKTIYEYE
jgi:hypothetical protein